MIYIIKSYKDILLTIEYKLSTRTTIFFDAKKSKKILVVANVKTPNALKLILVIFYFFLS